MNTLRTIVQPILIALLLAFAVRSTMRIYSVPTASMEPTLRPGDHIVVTMIHGDAVQAGDVVVFHSPEGHDELLVKRVVAMPGDRIESRGGRVCVHGHTVPEAYLASPAGTDFIAPQVIPAGHYFVLGDNRGNSYDSRRFGPIAASLVIGRARLVLWSSAATMPPVANASPMSRTMLRSAAVRCDRLFKPIE